MALSDGSRLLPLAIAKDYKRAGDGDTGPNTGGIGAGPVGETLLGEMEVTEDPATVAAIVAEVRKTQLRFGAIPSGTACTASSRPPTGWPRTARSRRPSRSSSSSCGPSRAPTSACTHRAGSPASATPPGWPSATGTAGCCWPATRRTSTRRPAGRASTSASRTRSTSAGNWPPRSAAGHRRGCWTALPHRTAPGGRRRAGQHPRADGAAVPRAGPPGAVRRLVSELMDFENVNRYLIEKITTMASATTSATAITRQPPTAAGRGAEAGAPLRADAPAAGSSGRRLAVELLGEHCVKSKRDLVGDRPRLEVTRGQVLNIFNVGPSPWWPSWLRSCGAAGPGIGW